MVSYRQAYAVMEAMPTRRLAATIGIAGVLKKETYLDALIQQADQALYAGKHAGRNRAVVSQEMEGET